MNKSKTQITSVSIQDQLYKIVRTDNPIKALVKGVYVDKVDDLSPTVHDCCMRVLGNVMDGRICNEILSKMPVCKETKHTVVTFITEKKFRTFNAMASRIDLPNSESTIRMDCLYTDDEDFDIDSLPSLCSESDCLSVEKGEHIFYDKDHIYAVEILSREFCHNIPYFVNDIIVYLPERVLI